MYTVKTLPEFDKWLNGLKDRITRLRLSRRLDKAQRGTLGDVKPVDCQGQTAGNRFGGLNHEKPNCRSAGF